MKRTAFAVLAILAITAPLSAQMLTTTFAAGNGQQGNMFDIVATNSVCITNFDVHIDVGTYDLEVYAVTGGGSYAPHVATASAWTLVGSATGVVSAGTGNPTPLPIAVNVPIAAGATQGFYVTLSVGGTMWYTNGTTVGAVFASDANIQFLEGVGKSYPFGSTFSPRVWNGNIYYVTGSCPTASPWQVNQPELSLDFNGVQSNGLVPGIATSCVGSIATVNFGGSLVGAPWDAAVTVNTTTVPLGGGGVQLPTSGQVVNINLLDPSLQFLFGGTFMNAYATASLPLGTPTVAIDAQLVALDVTSPDGLRLSQAATLQPSAGTAGPIAGPTLDDGNATVNLGAPNCWLPGGFTFCGTNYTQIHVSSNGRVLFNAPNTDYFPALATALTNDPFVGNWTDLNPTAGGTISITNPATNQVQVDYVGVASYTSGMPNTFSVLFDGNTGNVAILGISGIDPAGDSAFLGLSCGNLGATDPGATSFGPPPLVGAGVLPSDMLYEFNSAGPVPALAAGVNSVTFMPAGGLGYAWVSN